MARRARGLGPALACWGAVSVVLAGGCTVNPSPEPPSLNPNLVRINMMTCTMGECTSDQVRVQGMAGAAAAGAELWIVNLDSDSIPTRITVAEDGGFSGLTPGLISDHYRILVRADGLRSPPLDIAIDLEGGLEIAASDAGCALLTPSLELELPATRVGGRSEGTLLIENGCDMPADVSSTLRVPTTAFSPADLPDPVAAGADATLTVSFTPPFPGLHEEILFIDVGVTRFVVTVLGEGS